MASGRNIKGITIELNGDATGLDKALKGVNSEIKDTKAQLKDVERLLKLDPTNTELLRQKQHLLGDAVNETKNKLKTLKEAEKQAQEQFKQGKISQAQYEALQREVIATEQELKKLESQASKSNATLSKISGTVGKAAQKTKALSAAAGGAIAGLAGIAYQAGVAADDINTLAKQSGFSTEQIQKWQYASDRIDVSVDDIISSAKRMKNNIDSTATEVTDAWARLGVSLTDTNGEFRASEDIFNDAVQALSRIENGTERDTIAMTLFGKSADSLAGIIDDGGAALEAFGKEAEEAGIILSQDALDGANAFNDAVDTLKAQAMGTFGELGAEIAEMLVPVLDDLAEGIETVLGWIRGLDEDQLKLIITILGVVAAIFPLLTALSGVINVITFITSTVIPGLSAALGFLAAHPIVLIIAAIALLALLIATHFEEIQAVMRRFSEFMSGIFAKDWSEQFGFFGEILNQFFGTIKSIWDMIKGVFQGIVQFVKGVFSGDWRSAWEGVKKIFSSVFNGLVSIAKAPINGIITILNGAIRGLNTMIRGINRIKVNIPSWVPGLGGKSLGFNISTIGSIPYMAKGGVLSSGSAIVGEAGPELLTMSGNRAIVQPLTNQTRTTNMGGFNIVINAAPGQNVEELAELVSEKISDTVARKGAVFA